jgi:sn1-specific diacylglycerol lipase
MCCCLRMLCHGRNDLSIEERYALIEGSDPCGTHRTAIGDWTSQELDTQLIHSNITISTKIKPYAVFYDAQANEVVIAIRGTLTLEDCVTDAMADPVQFDSEGFVRVYDMSTDSNPNARWAHEGMLICALSIRDDIAQKQILSNLAYNNRNAADVKSPLVAKSIESPFRLVIVGHSLGAGIAAILAMLMRKQYPHLRCYTYGTPGSVVDRRTAHDMKAYVTSVVLADDLISRMSYHSLMSLQIAILDCLARACVNKMKIFQSILKSVSSIRLGDYLSTSEDNDSSYNNDFKQSLLQHIANNRQSLSARIQPRLYLPGRIVHIQAKNLPPLTSLCCFGRSSLIFSSSSTSNYEISLSTVDDFLEIPMSTTMAWDHFPDRYLDELRKLSLSNVSHSDREQS